MSLQAPWRIDYIRSLSAQSKEPGGCFLCEAAVAPPEKWPALHILWRTDLTVVMLNRFPYANGHVLIAPLAHLPEYEDLSPEQVQDLGVQTQKALALLRKTVSAQGFNVGMNLGRCAGAGVPGHLHQHAVPRWGGDINFMSVVGEIRVIPQALGLLYTEMMTLLSAPTSGR